MILFHTSRPPAAEKVLMPCLWILQFNDDDHHHYALIVAETACNQDDFEKLSDIAF